ncbi:MAG TPA: 16S rRNA (uracil(1498)-N(3))-methyltransferase [Pyrinomonadaceae bacterium]|nr:16S rRNA (uracil(1498)-N(3))-methyltransferase [Pyrinomonadaceae bacterium]
MHRFYCPPQNFDKEQARLDAGETHHLRDVLRLKAGDAVNIFDGQGREFTAEVNSVTKREAILRVIASVEPAAPESPLDFTVAAAVTPAEKFDLAVEKAVEIGVRRFVPLITDRTEVKASVAARRLERWRRIAFEAAKQCGRAVLMRVEEPIGFGDVFDRNQKGQVILFSERGGSRIEDIPPGVPLMLIYGPKGGWSDAELELARKKNAAVVTLGGRILRAETAAIALTAIIQHRFGDMN